MMNPAGLVLGIIAVFNSLLQTEMHPVLEDYEVVRPVQLHTQHRRHAELPHTDTVSYRLQMKEKSIDIHLRKSRSLVSSSYTETHYTPNGSKVTKSIQDQVEHECYYHGTVGDEQQFVASISTCRGLRGFFRTQDQDYMIEPLQDSVSGEHAVFKAQILQDKEIYCGVTNQSMDPALPVFNSRRQQPVQFAVSSQTDSILTEQKYIETYLVVDNSEYKNLGSDLSRVRKRMFEIINFVNMVYLPLHTFIALVGLEVWSDADKIDVVPSAAQTLSSFTSWRSSNLKLIQQNDNAQLISAVNFGAIAGLAHVGSLCTMDSTTLVRDFSSNALETGAVLAHELGHNLGMMHDTTSCSCSEPHCIMGATLSFPPPEDFSNCSVAEYVQFLQSSPALQCVLNEPAVKSILTPAVCGNRIQEEGEQCDCGPVQDCTDPCCNAATCRFTAGSQCSTGDCCEDCKFRPLASMCRNIESECDLPEYCTGTSSDCPVDTFRANGISCRNDSGYCYSGQCPLLLAQCTSMWGDAAEVASDSCYDLNMRGTHYGYCTRPYPEDYVACKQKDVMCGRLFCSNGTALPEFGTGVTIGSCKTTVYQDYTHDYGQVQTGTKCGEGQVCSDSACVEMETVYAEPNCSTKCSEHAVCNNKAECQCVPGWVPPDCTQRYTEHITFSDSADAEAGQSKDMAIAVGICGVALLCLICAAVGIWLISRKTTSHGADPNRNRPQVWNVNV